MREEEISRRGRGAVATGYVLKTPANLSIAVGVVVASF